MALVEAWWSLQTTTVVVDVSARMAANLVRDSCGISGYVNVQFDMLILISHPWLTFEDEESLFALVNLDRQCSQPSLSATLICRRMTYGVFY